MRDDATRALAENLNSLMVGNGFQVEISGEELCRDDWESSVGPEVNLRWAFWKKNIFSKPTCES
jgi:hypothetical protein